MSRPIGFWTHPTPEQGSFRFEGPVVSRFPRVPALGDLVTFKDVLWMYVSNPAYPDGWMPVITRADADKLPQDRVPDNHTCARHP